MIYNQLRYIMTVIEATSGPSVLANVVAAEIVLAAGGSKVTPEATRRIQGYFLWFH
jgi:uncharacterized protein YjdB